MKRNWHKSKTLPIWIFANITVLVISLINIESDFMHDFFAWSMIYLGFPVNYVLLTIIGISLETLEEKFSITFEFFTIPAYYPRLIIFWVLLFSAGYLQWFKLIPYLYKKSSLYLKARQNPIQ